MGRVRGVSMLRGRRGSSYALVAGDVGSTLRVVVTASNGAGSASATSAQTGVVVAQPSSGTMTFSVVADGDDGDVTSANPFSQGYPPGGSAAPNASGSVLTAGRRAAFGDFEVNVGLVRFDTSGLPDGATVTSATLKVFVTATRDDDNRDLVGEWYGASSWPIDAGDYSLSSTGSALAGSDITALVKNDVNSFVLSGLSSVSTTGSTGLRLHVSGGQPAGDNYVQLAALENPSKPEPQLVVSYSTGPATAPSNTVLPVVSGTAEVGQTLSASQGSWSGSTPMSFAYQWRRCDASGAGCVDIAGATSSSHVLVGADVGSTVRVVVTASNSAGSASAASAQTGVVVAQPSSGTTTFSVVAGGDDGDLALERPQAQGYPPSGTVAANASGSVFTVGRRAAFGQFEVLVGLLRFDTSGLPDGATVTSATLKLHVSGRADADDRALMAEWYPGSSWPIDAADFSLASSGSALAGADLSGLSVGAVNSLVLSGLSSVSTTGSTGLRLHVSGGQPAGDNYVQIAAVEHATFAEAQLVVTWTTS